MENLPYGRVRVIGGLIQLVGFGRPERFVRIGATLRVLLDAFAQAAQPDSKFCPLHAGNDEFRDAVRIEDERAFERNAMTAASPTAPAQS